MHTKILASVMNKGIMSRPRTPPFFTVVIPTYNRLEYLREAVASVLQQTYQNFELIVVDDNPDETARPVVKTFVDERLFYVKNDHNRGGAGTRNAGIFRSRGEWVAFLDDDDIWLPEKLERQYQKILELDKDVGLIYSGNTKFDAKTLQTVGTFIPTHEGWLYQQLLYKNVIGGLFSVAIRRDILDRLGGLDERFPALQDLELYTRVAKQYKVAFIAEPLVRVRTGSAGRITTNYHSKLVGSQLFWEKFKDDIAKSKLLKHRAASRVFKFAFASGDTRAVLACAPWVLTGLLIDRRNFGSVLRFMATMSFDRLMRFRRSL